jgi:adenine-specific DNA methylase
MADFFYVWLRLALKNSYPLEFTPEYTPKTLEAVANSARQPGPGEADAFYQRLLTQAWREAHRVLKPGGTLAFTFHHSEDDPWVAVLESLFDAGFYLEATYPIRSDETKGEGEFLPKLRPSRAIPWLACGLRRAPLCCWPSRSSESVWWASCVAR